MIHRNLPTNQQVAMVRKVKREETIIIRNVHTVSPETPISEVRNIMRTKNIGGLPVVVGEKLVGIVTRRDLEFAGKEMKTVEDVMVRNVISARDSISLDEAIEILYKNRIEKLPPLVDERGKGCGPDNSEGHHDKAEVPTRHKGRGRPADGRCGRWAIRPREGRSAGA